MNTVTVESLQKDLRNTHGVTVDIAKYSQAQLESYSKKIQNKLKEFETKHKFNESLGNSEYQKTLLISKIVETAINQYLDNPLESIDELDLGEDVINVDETDADVARDFADENVQEGTYEGMPSKADVMKCCKDGMSITEICKKYPDCDQDKLKEMCESCMSEMKESTNESVVKEGAEEQAELTMAAKDMVDRFTAFLEDVAEMGAEGMLELADSIRDELGQEQADAFVATVKPALEATQEVLTTSREALTSGVQIVTGETAPTDTIGDEPAGDIEEPMDGEPVDPIDPTDDEFGASEPATGGDEPEGREKREGYTPAKKSIEESTRIMNKLAQ